MAYETGRFTHADASAVHDRADFVEFVNAVLEDLRGSGPHQWENATLERFLEALAAVTDDYGATQGVHDRPTWQGFARLVEGATGYE